MNQAVDAAMALRRRAKDAVRALWLEVIQRAAESEGAESVLYTTLSGAEGIDIQMLIDANIVKTTEVGAIDPINGNRVIAIERSLPNVAKLQKTFPNLRTIPLSVEEVVGGTRDPLNFPPGKQRDALTAQVINLDFDGPLLVSLNSQGGLEHPHLETVRKIAAIQAAQRIHNRWSLLLTLQGEIVWSPDAQAGVLSYLARNCREQEGFRERLAILCGDRFVASVEANDNLNLPQVDGSLQQKLVSIFVAKRICYLVSGFGWVVETNRLLRYGGGGGHAPMCTWIFTLNRDEENDPNPDAIYSKSLTEIFEQAGAVLDDGTLVRDYT